jgi:hypothetical protein
MGGQLKVLEFPERIFVPERNSILQTAALQHRITAVPKLGWKGREVNSPEPPRLFRNRLLAGFPEANSRMV